MRQVENSPPPSVLVVEDQFLIRMITVDVIEDAGFRVYAADRADEAIRMLEQRRDIGFVFTDIEMPGSMDGLALARRVGDRWPDIRVIVTSGGGQTSRMNLPPGGVFIAKPYSLETLVAKLRATLAEPVPVH